MKVIQWLRDYKESEAGLNWNGTFGEYLELVTKNPHLAMHAHARIYEMIMAAGATNVNGNKKYNFFSEELFGIDKPLEKLVEEYFHSSAKRLDVRKRILLLMGPVSGGKSTIVCMLKRA